MQGGFSCEHWTAWEKETHVLTFGAGGHVGSGPARWLAYCSSDVRSCTTLARITAGTGKGGSRGNARPVGPSYNTYAAGRRAMASGCPCA